MAIFVPNGWESLCTFSRTRFAISGEGIMGIPRRDNGRDWSWPRSTSRRKLGDRFERTRARSRQTSQTPGNPEFSLEFQRSWSTPWVLLDVSGARGTRLKNCCQDPIRLQFDISVVRNLSAKVFNRNVESCYFAGKFERISDSTWFQTFGSHSICVWGLVRTRSYQGYAPQL